MLYLEFLHIKDFGEYLKGKNVHEAYASVEDEKFTDDTKHHRVTFSARVEDHVALCTLGFLSRSTSSPEESIKYVEEQVKMLAERISHFDVSVKRGRWTDKTPRGLANEEDVG
jgi:hypothetical protein